jgi:hypothetical protein
VRGPAAARDGAIVPTENLPTENLPTNNLPINNLVA